MKPYDYWNQAAGTKVFTTPFHSDVFSAFVSKDVYILDVGCGYGRTLKELHDLGYTNLHGIDFSEKMIERGLRENGFLDLNCNDFKIRYAMGGNIWPPIALAPSDHLDYTAFFRTTAGHFSLLDTLPISHPPFQP